MTEINGKEIDERLRTFIADKIELAETERKEIAALNRGRFLELSELMTISTNSRLAEVKDYPEALIPYTRPEFAVSTGNQESWVAKLKDGYRPESFIVQAPELAVMRVKIRPVYNESDDFGILYWIVSEIKVGQNFMQYTDWANAIDHASDEYQEMAERAAKQSTVRIYGTTQEPDAAGSVGEGIEALLRVIVREEIEMEQGRDV